MTIGNRVLNLLNQKGLRQKDLAEFLGTTPSTINGWRAENRNPSSDLIVRICEFLDVSYEYLLTGEESVSTPSRSTSLSPDEEEMLTLFRQLPVKEQYKLIGRMEEKIEMLHNDAEDPVAARELLQAK